MECNAVDEQVNAGELSHARVGCKRDFSDRCEGTASDRVNIGPAIFITRFSITRGFP